MTRASLAGWAIVAGFLLLAVVSGRAAIGDGVELLPAPAEPGEAVRVASPTGFLYGRVTMTDGLTHEGRLRFGGDEEALWSHYFNGRKVVNPWAESAPASALVRTQPREIAGVGFGSVERKIDLERPFMVRLGDIARIDAERRTLSVTLRSGDVVTLDRFEADDFADGIRVWDDTGRVDLDEWRIRSVEFLPTPADMAGPAPLRGTVRTAEGDFSGLLQWDREEAFVDDLLRGRGTGVDNLAVPFAFVRSVERLSDDALLAVLQDGDELRLTDLGEALPHRGIYVDDARYGRVLVSWNAVRTVTFGAAPESAATGYTESATAANGSAVDVLGFEDFTGGTPLRGAVTTRTGERIAGRLVYDLDESRTIETLDAPWAGVDYTIPFGLVASIEPAALDADPGAARVTLRSGEVLALEPEGDLGPGVAGVLVFSEGGAVGFVPWTEVARIDFDAEATGAQR